MEDNKDKMTIMESLIERIEDYSKTSYELFKLKAVDKISSVLSATISNLCSVVFLFIFVIIVHIALAIWLGELMGKTYYGFFVVAAFDIIIWVVLSFVMNNWLKKRISNSIISQMLNG
ncbi:MAG: hypothetical protein H0W84_02840 [Bacteroidetes bacterium]|nr:hypothetical protein [Bacteroidota bacterium]